jgi:hypothetical protein
MTFDLGCLLYADAVTLPEGEWRYCAACRAVFRPSRRDRRYCSVPCKTRVTVQTMRARRVHPGKRGRPRTPPPTSPLARCGGDWDAEDEESDNG